MTQSTRPTLIDRDLGLRGPQEGDAAVRLALQVLTADQGWAK